MTDYSLQANLEKELDSLTEKQRKVFLKLLGNEDIDTAKYNKIRRKANTSETSLSFAQERLWFLSQLEGPSPNYNIFLPFRITGVLDRSALIRSVERIVARHEILRARFVSSHGVVQQQETDGENFSVSVEKITNSSQLVSLVKEESCSTFDLSEDILIRVRLLVESESSHVLLLNMHHIVSDGWSIDIFFRELASLYPTFKEDCLPELTSLNLQYSDYAIWQRECLSESALESQLSYWRGQLQDINTQLSLPTDRPRPVNKTYNGKYKKFEVSPSLLKKLSDLSLHNESTIFMVLLSVFYILLWRYTGESDLAVGTPVANRNSPEVEDIIGFFVNTLIMRIEVDRDLSFNDFLSQVRRMTLDAYEHQDIPFERLVNANYAERSQSHSPLFQTMFAMHNINEKSIKVDDVEFSRLDFQSGIAKFDFTVFLSESVDGIAGVVEYNTDLYDEVTIDQFISHYLKMLEEVANAPEKMITDIEFLVSTEKQRILKDWTDTNIDYRTDLNLHELFLEQSASSPKRIAVKDATGQLSYEELATHSKRISYELSLLGVSADELIGVAIDKSCNQIGAVMGVLCAGAAYLPVDVSWPEGRQHTVLAAGKCRVVLSVSHISASAQWPADIKVINVDELPTIEASILQSYELPAVASTDLAYVIFTSGSTGTPKGVMIEHGSVVNTIYDINSRFSITADDSVLALSSLSFDLSVYDIFGLLAVGGCIVLPSDEDRVNPAAWISQLAEHRVTLWNTVPGVFQLLIDYLELEYADKDPQGLSLRLALLSGDWLPVELPRKSMNLLPTLDIVSLGGATEASIWSNCYAIDDVMIERKSIPYGKPLGNQRFYILDELMQVCPIGVEGYLYIAGVGLARGYWDDPDQTANCFIEHEGLSEKIYKTGDLGRWMADGNIEFLGRRDGQVKIRGYRIELGEVESQLKNHEVVNSCVAVVREDEPGDRRLVAYVTTVGQAEEKVGEVTELLRSHLQQSLPDYMVPSAIMVLEKIPLTENGKVDRKGLPVPSEETYVQDEYVAPETEAEKILVEIWAELLGLAKESISITSNFFELGGHSLLLTRLLNRLQDYALAVDMRSVFRAKNLRTLAADLQALNAINAEEVSVPTNEIPLDCDQITPNMLTMVDLTIEDIEIIEKQIPGRGSNIQDIYPLTPLQEGLFFHHLLEPDDDPYSMAITISFESDVLLKSYLEAMRVVVSRHDVLRTSILHLQLSSPVQVVQRNTELHIENLKDDEGRDLDSLDQLKSKLSGSNLKAIDLSQAPLLKFGVMQDKTTGNHLLLTIFHHLILDHVSLEIMQSEIKSILARDEASLPPPIAGREAVASMIFRGSNDGENYFREKLGKITEPTFPYNLSDVYGSGKQIECERLSISSDLSKKIRFAAQAMHVSPAPMFHAAWALVIAACTNKDKLVFGTVLSGRNISGKNSDRLIGMFINTLPLVLDLQGMSSRELVIEADLGLRELMEHEHLSLNLAQSCSAVPKGTPLFSSIINYRHSAPISITDPQKGSEEGLSVVWMEELSNYPFAVSIDDTVTSFSIEVQVDSSVSAKRVLAYMNSAIEVLTQSLIDEPAILVSELSLLNDKEQHQQLVEWSGESSPFPVNKCFHELFEEQVTKNPNNLAISFGSNKLTYDELNRKANKLARYLLRLGLKPDTPVGICTHRSLEMLVGLLAIVKAGGAYLPIDPNYPANRIRYMLEDSKLEILLCQSDLTEQLPILEQEIVFLDTEIVSGADDEENLSKEETGLSSKNLCYVIYTSGSTGKPKAVMVEHCGWVNLAIAQKKLFAITQDSRGLQFASLSFDAAAFEISMVLAHGASLFLTSEAVHKSPKELALYVEQNQITHVTLPPILLSQLPIENMKSVTTMIVAGESVSKEDARPWIIGRQFFNAYGPTETTVCATAGRLLDDQSVTIGKPLPNVKVYILNRDLKVLPTGIVGELFVGGEGVARGYLNNEELTREKFSPNPYSSTERMYRTGDLVRWLPDGNIEFVGRTDYQTKIRGFRIELGEIESELTRHDSVVSCVVVSHKKSNKENQLVAYAVLDVNVSNEKNKHSSILIDFLHYSLPDYMVPRSFIFLESMPLSINGKIDRNALPPLSSKNILQAEVLMPKTQIEKQLVEIWSIVLELKSETISTDADLFDLGGHSLSATRIINLVGVKMKIELPIKVVLKLRDIRSIARWLDLYVSSTGTKDAVSGEVVFEELFL
ncbi:MAG: hypothetical protein COA78_04060 [Blastopirellula sp.]|nr:MAG: hypothetical protein COA78_04060 [Blastopirellula sp.]